MRILNEEAIDEFLFKHREKGCIAIRAVNLKDEFFKGPPSVDTVAVPLINTHWKSRETGETIRIIYED